MIAKLLSATVLAAALATSAMAQSNGTGSNGSGSTSGTSSGMNGGNGTGTGTGTGSGGSVTPTDPNATNSTTAPNGMADRCKDAAGNDIDNNTASGATTSNMQNCNK
ncbi:hypothetical protein C7I87_02870 [Mesorhizobium sp. SARCC-RB16n]|uniref:hypothetical protein n=1 Tax=Mesorhizobium sp. SARCC-RB16n TaxID=2116687 RepID=UPI00122F5441|nr:hypothetical protein [Mesorhizobium sp. SARCC-RB16n]KAA3452334.1 hypothetical protein C7I87_02870 [Mesorhizobium sp. SARCC-RB16n]